MSECLGLYIYEKYQFMYSLFQEKMASLALVLFDVDGCTAIVSSKKLGDPKELKKGQHAHIRLNQEQMKVEILELSDSKTFLNKFEDEWTNTHRSIALDKEKKRRKNKPHGYLQVWPTDMEDATHSSDGEDGEDGETVTEVNETARNVSSTNSSTEGKRTGSENKKQQETTKSQKSTRTTNEGKEKTGSNGRKVTVLHEGSGDLTTNICTPKRAPGFLEGLSGDEIDLIQSQIQDFRQGKRSVAVQTDQVVVLGPNDNIPEKKLEDMLKRILESQNKEVLPLLKEISGTQLASALSILKTISDVVSTRDFQGLLLSGLSQEKPLPVLRLRESSSSLPDVDLLDCLETSHPTESTPSATESSLDSSPASTTSIPPPSSSGTSPASTANILPPSSSGTSPASTSSIPPPSSSGTSPASTSSIPPPSSSGTSPASTSSIPPPSSSGTSPASTTSIPPSTALSNPPVSTHVSTSAPLCSQTCSTPVPACVQVSTVVSTLPASPLPPEKPASNTQIPPSRESPSAWPTSNGNVTAPSTAEPIISPPPLNSRRGKKPFNFECAPGPLHEISSPNDMAGIPSDAEVRIRQSVISDVLEESCSRGNLSWRLTQAVYRSDELSGRNYKGGRNKLALSPRRRHAVEHAVIENYGMTKETFFDIYSSVNTGLRNMKMRNRFPLLIVTPNNNSQ
ncbi:uncharacterized protein LOC133202425 [Saccostrea echinata]|uniref:uncharacterized protein LOC133202425 n=1 Tax=Saccostrea echinata TaxID=191078 RepID=UPI002A81E5A7|nr:uncharacterized protein LOC133202425 [Saccostrea echinata]